MSVNDFLLGVRCLVWFGIITVIVVDRLRADSDSEPRQSRELVKGYR